MKIAISGSSGFIGKYLTDFLQDKGIEVIPLYHCLFEVSQQPVLSKMLERCNVVINLAGATINHRWTPEYKKEIIDSRINSTRALVHAINQMNIKPQTFISTSAVGIYPSSGIVYTEDSKEYDDGFLAQVCKQWEEEAHKISLEVRLVISRFGIVLANDGGALPEMILPFRLFAGGRIASGRQGFSWVHITDLLRAFYYVIEHPELAGIFNLTATDVVTNRDFAHIIAHELHRPDWFPLPTFITRLIFGERHELMTNGPKAYPKRLTEAGFKFKYNKLYQAIQNLYP